MATVLIVSVVMFVLALVVGAVATASLLGRLPRNRWAGVRTPESMRDDETFVMANRVAGPTNAAAALLLLIGGAASLMLSGAFAVVAVVACVLAAFVTAGIGGSIGARAAAAAPVPVAEDGCGHSCISCTLKDACQPS
ncbi:putative membrane protein [Rhodococcus sp. UYP5]